LRARLTSNPVDIVLLDVVNAGRGWALAGAPDSRPFGYRHHHADPAAAKCWTASSGSEIGADDYIAKPFHLREVLARVKSVLRRRKPAREPAAPPPAQNGETIRFDAGCLTLPAASSSRPPAPRYR